MTRQIRFTNSPVKMCWYLKGERSCVQFIVLMGWEFSELDATVWPEFMSRPMPMDLGYHSSAPIHEDDTPIEATGCEFTHGPCYYDGSSRGADRLFKLLIEKGDEAVWLEMEKEFIERFGANEEKVK